MHLAPTSRTHWLENPQRKTRSGKRRRKARRRRLQLTRQSKGGTVARRRRRRRSAATPRPRRRRRRRNVVMTNRPRRRRRHHRRNGYVSGYVPNPRRRRRRRRSSFLGLRRNPGFSVRGIIGEAKDAAVLAGQVIAGKALTRIVRNRVTTERGTKKQVAIELAVATALGVAAGMVNKRLACNIMAGGYVGAFESLIHQLNVPVVSEALADDGNPQVISVPPAVASAVSGYVKDALSGYVDRSQLGDSGSTVSDVSELSFIDG